MDHQLAILIIIYIIYSRYVIMDCHLCMTKISNYLWVYNSSEHQNLFKKFKQTKNKILNTFIYNNNFFF